ASVQSSGNWISLNWSTSLTGRSITAAFRAACGRKPARKAAVTLILVAKVEQKGTLSKEDLRDFFREMLLIRRFEEKVEERFRAGELPGFLHVAIGQEAVAVGVCRALEEGDIIASTHRAHGHTLAKGTTPNELMAELYGKLEGCSHGYGGVSEPHGPATREQGARPGGSPRWRG